MEDSLDLHLPPRGSPKPLPAAEPARPNATANWSVGAGISYSSDGFGPMALGVGLGSSGGPTAYVPSIPGGALLLERRLSRSVFLLLQPNFYMSRSAVNDIREAVENSVSIDAQLGFRWVINPGGAVEVGLAHTVVGSYNRTNRVGNRYRTASDTVSGGDVWADTTGKRYGFRVSTALVVERELTKGLWLRLSGDFLRVGYAETTIRAVYEDDWVEEDSANAWAIGFYPAGNLLLRLAF